MLGGASSINLPSSELEYQEHMHFRLSGPLDDQRQQQQQQLNSQSNIIMTNVEDESFQEQDMGLFDTEMDYNDTMQVFTIKTIQNFTYGPSHLTPI
jgi:hypothetical protein